MPWIIPVNAPYQTNVAVQVLDRIALATKIAVDATYSVVQISGAPESTLELATPRCLTTRNKTRPSVKMYKRQDHVPIEDNSFISGSLISNGIHKS